MCACLSRVKVKQELYDFHSVVSNCKRLCVLQLSSLFPSKYQDTQFLNTYHQQGQGFHNSKNVCFSLPRLWAEESSPALAASSISINVAVVYGQAAGKQCKVNKVLTAFWVDMTRCRASRSLKGRKSGLTKNQVCGWKTLIPSCN